MEHILDFTGLGYFWGKIKSLFATGTAGRTQAIPFGKVDSTSTATAFTATVEGVTELKNGTCVLLKNGVVTSAANFTININGLGAKPSYSNMATGNSITPTAPTRDTTIFNINYTMLFVYNSTLVDGGAWVCYRGYDANTNTLGYQLRTSSYVLNASDAFRYYVLLFTSADGTKWVPANSNKSNSATTAKTVNQTPINPFGEIVYCGNSTNYSAGSAVTATAIWQQYTIALGYSFNKTGAALTLTTKKPVYVKCAPQADGSAIIDSTTPYVQDLPTTEDGKIYILLGMTYSATNIELLMVHPVYYYKGGTIRLWTNAAESEDTAITNSEIDTIWDSVIPIVTLKMTGGDALIFNAGTKADGTSLEGYILRTGETVDIIGNNQITIHLQTADTSSGFWNFYDYFHNYQYSDSNGNTYYIKNIQPRCNATITFTPLDDVTFYADID